MNFLEELKPGYVQSFGLVYSISNGITIVKYKDASIQLTNVNILCVEGDWLKFYGRLEKKVIACEYVENLRGRNINILEKAIHKINANINSL